MSFGRGAAREGAGRSFFVVVAALTACAPNRAAAPVDGRSPPARESATSDGAPTCRYDVAVAHPTAQLDVTAHCTGAVTTHFAGDRHLTPFITDVRDGNGAALARDGARFVVPASNDVRIRYHVDLDGAARVETDVDTAFALGGSLVAPLSSYALVPEPPRPGVAIVHVQPGPSADFVTELARAGGDYTIALSDIPDATYGVFGRFEHDVVALAGVHGTSSVDVLSLDGAFASSRLERKEWVARAAAAVGAFYGGFPAERAGVVLDPIPARDRVVFGKVLSGGGSTVALFVGANTPRASLDSDWVLVHEFFHLGFPSFRGEGKWLDEGLATYFEPLIRARAGMLTEEQGWAEVIRDMPLGVELCETRGLDHFDGDIRAVYWGGAVVALHADVAARRREENAPGLEQALRAMLAQGWNSRHVVRLRDAIQKVDAGLGAPILEGLAAAYSDHGSPVPLDSVLADLGVERHGDGVLLRDDAKLARVRRAIMYGDAAFATR